MANADRILNAGVIGYGLGGATFHAPFIAITPGMRLSAIMTSDPARRAAAAERYPDTRIASSFDELVGGPTKLDLIAISTPNATHVPLARAALEAGAHVVVDKPFATSAKEAREIEALAARVGRSAFPFQNRRWDGDFLTLIQLISNGSLGDVQRFESRFDRWRPIAKPGWTRPDARERAEDVLYDLGTHLIDQALVLFGPVVSVYAELECRNKDVVTFDDMFLALTHVSGVRTHLHSTMTAGIARPRMNVFGSKAAYVKYGVDIQEEVLRAGARPGTPNWGEEPEDRWGTLGSGGAVERVPTLPGAYQEFYAGVARAIFDGAPPPVPIADVAAGLAIIEAAYLSAAQREVVTL
ncbi:MAG: Gfo/Idh/MocA family oxidoreductase [bacterium]